MFNEDRASLLHDESVLVIGCNSELYVVLNCTLKMVKMANFMSCVFYHNLKREREGLSICTSSEEHSSKT